MRAGLVLLGAFALVTLLVGQRVLEPADLALMALVKQVVSPELDAVAGVLNYVAAAEVTVVVGCLLAAWLHRRGVPARGAVAPLFFLASLPPEMVLKFTLNQPVPSEFYRPTLKYGLLSLTTMQSYPSGHSIRTAFFAVLLAFLLRRTKVAWVGLAALAVLSAWCRVYQGHHWPMDVIGGQLLGAALGCFAVAWLAPYLEKQQSPGSSDPGFARVAPRCG
jgi:membrane-associated phospholipid phosphatase